ncbi:MAG: PAS domain-containing protein [Anaerolineales bacterium]|nr:MAG: PAS domain-containing protein [Anaerolineales bacterium]
MDKNKVTLEDYAFLNRLLEGCQIIGRDFKYLFMNEVLLEHGKQTWDNLLGKTMMEAYPGIEDTEVFAKLKEVMESGMPQRMLNHSPIQTAARDGSISTSCPGRMGP